MQLNKDNDSFENLKFIFAIVDFRLPISDLKAITKISIIIPARNEAENIGNCLQSIIKQSYSKRII
jgi:cellulose synthase/poly-beta-1,6-N-acetylglucosamine synthase-like glycosyltransferase